MCVGVLVLGLWEKFRADFLSKTDLDSVCLFKFSTSRYHQRETDKSISRKWPILTEWKWLLEQKSNQVYRGFGALGSVVLQGKGAADTFGLKYLNKSIISYSFTVFIGKHQGSRDKEVD